MASIIDNRKKTMLDSLKNSLKQAEKVDILTVFSISPVLMLLQRI